MYLNKSHWFNEPKIIDALQLKTNLNFVNILPTGATESALFVLPVLEELFFEPVVPMLEPTAGRLLYLFNKAFIIDGNQCDVQLLKYHQYF